MEHNTINNMKKALLIVCLFISVIASGQNNFFWSHNSSGGYGLLYNWYAATSTDKITSSDDWVVPTTTQISTLITYLGGSSVSGGKLKEIGFKHWNSPNTGATNEVGFNAVGSGIRVSGAGTFNFLKQVYSIWTSTEVNSTNSYAIQLAYNGSESSGTLSSNSKTVGMSIRLLYVGAVSPTQYVGNNGYVYGIIQIGTQYWLAQNLRETKLRSGTDIPNVTDNAAWSALTTPAWCVYDNNFKYR